MKRTTSKVALETVLFTISGLQKIKIYDRINYEDQNPKLLFDGMAKDFMSIRCVLPTGYSEYRVSRSEIHGISVDGEYLVFMLQTKYEEY